MSNFVNNNNSVHILEQLFNIYDKVMVLKLYVDSNDENLFYKYLNAANEHNNKVLYQSQHIDAGFDLFAPGNEGEEMDTYGINTRFFGPGWQDRSPVNKLDHKICCSARMFTDTGKNFNTGYYIHPRSSIYKTPLRLANSTGIIDSGYRGHLIGMLDASSNNFVGAKYERYLQICAPGLVPIIVEVVNNINDLGGETERGAGGFGSTGR